MEYVIIKRDELYHHGIRGQKWGVRRFQNEDGSLTPAGRKRYADLSGSERRREYRADKKAYGAKAAKRIRANREAGMSRTAASKNEYKLSKDMKKYFGRRAAINVSERRHNGESLAVAKQKESTKALLKKLGAIAAVTTVAAIAAANFDTVVNISKSAADAVKKAMYVDPNVIDLKPSQYREIFEIAGYLNG